MSFRLYPLPQSKIPVLREILKARLIESNLQERSDADDCLVKVDKGYGARVMAAYVDDVQNPKCCLVMSHFPSIATSGTLAHISLVYVAPEKRGDLEVVKVILTTAENYAKFHQADTLAGTSWLYRGSKSTDALWKRNGFEIQETIYVKHLT
jgi:hypothetical protein